MQAVETTILVLPAAALATVLAVAMVPGPDIGEAALPAGFVGVTANGLVLSPSTMTSLLLGEQVVHGLDIARAARIGWEIDPADALKVIPGVLTVAPQYLPHE